MNSWIVWAAFVLVTLVLGLIGYHFSLRVLRIAAGFIALATVIYITWYGLAHPAQPAAGSLSGAFSQGADAFGMALFRQAPGHLMLGPGPVGWIIIIVLLVIGYRELEAWATHFQARVLDTSALAGARHGSRQDDTSGDGEDVSGKRRHDRLVAELRFRLPAVEVRAPSILPGGSRSRELASIAEASGVSGGGLAGAMIRFFGVLWPSPRRLQVRVWVEGFSGAATRVTVSLQDPQTGASIATKTLAARDVDEAASVVAGFVARQIFAEDPTAPPWCTGAADGRDLAAMLLARQVRLYPESEHEVRRARQEQIQILENVAGSNLCAGVTRYELAHLYDLEGRHVEALLLHAINRERYPGFYRGRYRLAMSLEMISNPDPGRKIDAAEVPKLDEALKILNRTGLAIPGKSNVVCHGGKAELSAELRAGLLDVAWDELQAIRRSLTLPHVIWRSFWRRDERGILMPYLGLTHRQAFHDGVGVGLLLVAVRRALNDDTDDRARKRAPDADVPPGPARKLPDARTTMRIASAIAGDCADIGHVLGPRPGQTARQRPPQLTRSMRTRRLPRQCSTRSWQAAYNLACAYAAIVHHHQRELRFAPDAAGAIKTDLEGLVGLVVTSLEFALSTPGCELDRPSEWIAVDPDFGRLRFSHDEVSRAFRDFLTAQRQRDYPAGSEDHPGPGLHELPRRGVASARGRTTEDDAAAGPGRAAGPPAARPGRAYSAGAIMPNERWLPVQAAQAGRLAAESRPGEPHCAGCCAHGRFRNLR